MTKLTLHDEAGAFEVALLEAPSPRRVVLFGVGGGGNPERHAPLLEALRDRGCTVVAPSFERMLSPIPTADALLLRARRLRLALAAADRATLPAIGVGHSIGAASLLALAGGTMWTILREKLAIEPEPRLARLALMAPATDFFRAPRALDAVRLPIVAWAGAADALTPPAKVAILRDEIGDRAPVELRVIEGAGHFSFMHAPPPGTTEPLADRDAFLASLVAEIGDFVIA
jgi:hypothetical protein